MGKIILDLCGGTGAWSKPYRDAGYDVRLVTLPDNDVLTYTPPKNVYGILAAPPCTEFSWARTNAKRPRDFNDAMSIVNAGLRIVRECHLQESIGNKKYTTLKFWALENPAKGFLPQFIGKPCYEFDPYDFGDSYRKRTGLWGFFNFPEKHPIKCNAPKFDRLKTKEIHGEFYGKYDRQTRRAITPAGFARAFFEANR